MKPAQLTQMIAAPMASIFLILSLCAFRFTPAKAEGSWLLLTRIFHNDNRFMNCLDDHRLVLHLHANGTVSINAYEYPVNEVRAVTQRIFQYRKNPEVWFIADPDTQMKDVGFILDRLHFSSRTINIFLITAEEMRAFENSNGEFESIAPISPDRFSDTSSICVFPDWPKIAMK